MTGWIDGKEADLSAAVGAIAKALGSSRQPLIIIDAIDLAGAAAAVELARAAAGVLDHAEPTNVRLMQDQGWIGTTQGEAVLRADAVLLTGPLNPGLANDEAFRKLAERPGRALYYIGPKATAPNIQNLSVIDSGNAPAFETIGVLRALVAGRKVSADATLVGYAEKLKAAKYGIAAFSSGALDELTGMALAGLVEDLSVTTRWTALPLGTSAGQSELIRMSLALTRLPPPLSFAKAVAQHDPWLYGASNILKTRRERRRRLGRGIGTARARLGRARHHASPSSPRIASRCAAPACRLRLASPVSTMPPSSNRRSWVPSPR